VGLLRVSPQAITVGPAGDEAAVATPPPPLAILSSEVDLDSEDVVISGGFSSVLSSLAAAGGSSAIDVVLLRGGVGRSLSVGGACDSAVPVNVSGAPSEDILPKREYQASLRLLINWNRSKAGIRSTPGMVSYTLSRRASPALPRSSEIVFLAEESTTRQNDIVRVAARCLPLGCGKPFPL
jgi:hypothetical protein